MFIGVKSAKRKNEFFEKVKKCFFVIYQVGCFSALEEGDFLATD